MSSRISKLAIIFVAAALLVVLNNSLRVNNERILSVSTIKKSTEMKMKVNLPREETLFSLLPRNISYCEQLMPKQEKTQSLYQTLRVGFDRVLQMQPKVNEGHSGRKIHQTYAYLQLGSAGFVKTICETGFNAGHSALAWLSTNPHSHVYSFDLGQHKYSKPMAAFLNETFPGRLTNIWGDSTITIPKFKRAHPDVECDLIIVDGGHTYAVALADLKNLRHLANKNYNIVVIDDCPSTLIPEVLRAWRDMLKTGYLEESWKCQFKKKKMGGFTIGRYKTNN